MIYDYKEKAKIIIGNIPINPENMDDCYTLSEYQEAKAMAIESLSVDQCEDTISRQSVLAETYSWSKDEFLRVTNPFNYLRKRVKSLPSVTTAPKKGHWIFKQRHKCVDVCCSECGYIRLLDYGYHCTVEELEKSHAMEEILAKGDMNFCEKCGARMVEEQNLCDTNPFNDSKFGG